MSNNIFLPLVERKSAIEYKKFYLGQLVEKLLLFDRIIIRSQRLNEIIFLIKNFSFDTTIQILKSKQLVFHIGIVKIDFNHTDYDEKKNKCSFYITRIETESHVKKCLQKIKKLTDINSKQLLLLESYLIPQIRDYSRNSISEHFEQFKNDILNNRSLIRSSIITRLEKGNFSNNLNPNKLSLDIAKSSSDKMEFKYETNLDDFISIDNNVEINRKLRHLLILESMLMFDTVNQRLLAMKTYDAITSFSQNEFKFLDEKIRFLFSNFDKSIDPTDFRRVIHLSGYPDIENIDPDEIDILKVLEIKNSEEVIYFRRWLNETKCLSDNDLQEILNSYSKKIGNILSTNKAKTLSLAVSTATDLIIYGSGFVISVIDQFLVEKFFPRNKAISFIDNDIQSIFKKEHNKAK